MRRPPSSRLGVAPFTRRFSVDPAPEASSHFAIDSDNCKRTPFEFLNGVTPTGGNINVLFPGNFVVSKIQGGGGMILDYAVGMSEICGENPYLPDSTGRLPHEGSDICESATP